MKMLIYKLHQIICESQDHEDLRAALDKHFRKDVNYTTVWDMPDGQEWPYLNLGNENLLVDEEDMEENTWIKLPEKLWKRW